MSRWIDADAFLKEYCELYPHIYKAMSRAMAEAPSIEIIRCGECKWFDSGKNDSEIWSMCTRHFGKYIDVNADDFCSYGNRSERSSE